MEQTLYADLFTNLESVEVCEGGLFHLTYTDGQVFHPALAGLSAADAATLAEMAGEYPAQ